MVDRKLGRGLDFFLSAGRSASSPAHAAPQASDGTLLVEVAKLHPNPNQPRRDFSEGELRELADSIKTSGVLQPILARRAGEGFQIVAGERRWRAAGLAGIDKVPVLIKDVSDEESAVFALVENLQRTDLNAIEKAGAFRQILDRFRISQEELARRVGLDRTSISNLIRLLELSQEIQDYVSRGTLSMGHARCLLAITDPAARDQLAQEAIRQGMSVRTLEERVREITMGNAHAAVPARPGRKSARARPVWLNELEETLVECLGTTVAIRYGKKKSEIVIQCVGREEFERVFARLKNC